MPFFWVTLRNRMEFFLGFLSFWWGKLNSVENPVQVDSMWITTDALPERKNCSVHPSRIHEGLINTSEGLIKRRLFFF